MITFDQGGRWKHLRKPENSECDATAKNKNEVCFTPTVICSALTIARLLNKEVLYLTRVHSLRWKVWKAEVTLTRM